jgi:hypothetical protein
LISIREGSAQQQVYHLHNVAESVVICWVPKHTGLPGNKCVDVTVKEDAVLGKLISDKASGRMFMPVFFCDVCYCGSINGPIQWTTNYNL